MSKGRLFVISAPSGAGKTTLLKGMMARVSGIVFSISHTTRKPRKGEIDGIDYHFVPIEKFQEMIAEKSFLEYAQVHNNYYGTSLKAVEQQIDSGIDVVLDIDVQGADILRNIDSFAAAYIFISPPDLDVLEKRLRGRGTESEKLISLRLKNAKEEMLSASRYEYMIINELVDESTDLLVSIVLAERARAHRLPSGEAIPIGAVV
jgi:guanylate kinase